MISQLEDLSAEFLPDTKAAK